MSRIRFKMRLDDYDKTNKEKDEIIEELKEEIEDKDFRYESLFREMEILCKMKSNLESESNKCCKEKNKENEILEKATKVNDLFKKCLDYDFLEKDITNTEFFLIKLGIERKFFEDHSEFVENVSKKIAECVDDIGYTISHEYILNRLDVISKVISDLRKNNECNNLRLKGLIEEKHDLLNRCIDLGKENAQLKAKR